jgi:hypothetical protein
MIRWDSWRVFSAGRDVASLPAQEGRAMETDA